MSNVTQRSFYCISVLTLFSHNFRFLAQVTVFPADFECWERKYVIFNINKQSEYTRLPSLIFYVGFHID